MAYPDRDGSHRKTKTYGKASRTSVMAHSPSRPLSWHCADDLQRPPDATVPHWWPAEPADQSRGKNIRARQNVDMPKLHVLSKPSKNVHRVGSKPRPSDQAAYDTSSSDDDDGPSPASFAQKRRRMVKGPIAQYSRENQKAELSSSQSTPTEDAINPRDVLPEVEVVIHTKQKEHPEPASNSVAAEDASSGKGHHPQQHLSQNAKSNLSKPLRSAAIGALPQQQEAGYPADTSTKNVSFEHMPVSRGGIKFGEVNISCLSPAKASPQRKRMIDRLDPSSGGSFCMRRISFTSETSPLPASEEESPMEAFQTRPRQPKSEKDMSSVQEPLPIGPRVTYTRQRSYLNEETIGSGDPQFSNLSTASSLPLRHATSKVASVSFTENPQSLANDADEDVGGGFGSVRNIYELRRAGEAARFEGLVDSIFEDLEDSTATLSSQRSSLALLCTKLLDGEFARRFLNHAMEKRLDQFRTREPDLICSFLIASAYGLLLSVGTMSSVAFKGCVAAVLHAVPILLVAEDDLLKVLKSPQTKASKACRSSIADLYKPVRISRIWGDNQPSMLSPQTLALRCIEMIVRRDREGGESRDILTDSTLEQIIGILLHNSEQTLKTAEEGKGEDQLTSFTLELTLSILESYTVALSNLSPDQEKLVRKLSCLGALLESLSDFEDSPKNRGICVLLVRLILNLTNNEAAICERFSTPPLVKALSNIVVNEIPKISGEASVDDVEAVTDFVILSLGCLINLSECSERFRSLFASTKHGSDLCLDILVTYFIDGKDSASEADNFEQMRFNVVLGYLSVFLCTLCLDDDIHKQLSKQLQHNGVDQLLGTVEEFLKYHKKVEEEVRDGMGHQDSNTTFIARLQGIVDRVRGGGTAH